MTELLSRNETHNSVAMHQAEIIRSVLKNGLIPAADLRREKKHYLGSIDSSPRGHVSVRLLAPQREFESYTDFGRRMDFALYKGMTSILPVMTERPAPRDDRFFISSLHNEDGGVPVFLRSVKLLEKRIASSFLIVIKSGEAEEFMKISRAPLPFPDKVSYVEYETRPVGRILPSEFVYLIFPEAIWQACSENILCGNGGNSTKIVGRSVERRLFKRNLRLTVPDYEQALVNILNAMEKPVFVHGVRLPIEEDLLTFNSK